MSVKTKPYMFGSLVLQAQAGDTWSKVSQSFEVSESALKKANKQSSELIEGQTFVVPPSNSYVHVVAPTETVDSICAKHNNSRAQLKALNGESLFLFVGKKLFLPK